MTHAEARDRRVIRRAVGGDNPKRDIVATAPLDAARGPLADRVGVHQQRDHHRRIVRRATPTIASIRGQEFGQIEPVDDIDHEPCEVILRQPLTQARRQQQLLLAITRDEVLRHPRIVLNSPDTTRFVRHPCVTNAEGGVV